MVLVEPPTAYLRFTGRAAVERARDFKLLVQRLSEQGIRKFCLDLTECRLMDSTFSGVLAALASELGTLPEGDGTRFVLVNPNERVRDLLDNLGVLPLVTVLEGTPPAAPSSGAEELAKGSESRAETTECCLDAHRFLMALSPQNVPKFRDLTRVLEAERAAAEKA